MFFRNNPKTSLLTLNSSLSTLNFFLDILNPLLHRDRMILLEPLEQLLRVVGDDDVFAVVAAHEAVFYASVYPPHQVIVIAEGVIQCDGFLDESELVGDDHFRELVEGAEAARHGDEGVRFENQYLLALRHGLGRNHLCDTRMTYLMAEQKSGHHADDLAAAFEHPVGDDVHQADAAATVDQGAAVVGEDVA